MSHATDGDLHAHLDGALASFDPVGADRLIAHLEACSDCRRRLDEAKATRERAGEILAGAVPGSVDIPPFEEIRRRAGAGGGAGTGGGGAARRRRGFEPSRLAWAASVALAVGAGWMGHAVWPDGPGAGFLADAVQEPEESSIVLTGGAREALPESEVEAGADDEGSLPEHLAIPPATVEGAVRNRAVAPERDVAENAAGAVRADAADRVARLATEPDPRLEAARDQEAYERGERAADERRANRQSAAEPTPAPEAPAPAAPETEEVTVRGLEARDADRPAGVAQQVAREQAPPDTAGGRPAETARTADQLERPGFADVQTRKAALDRLSDDRMGGAVWHVVSGPVAERWAGGRLLRVSGLPVEDFAIALRGDRSLVRVGQSLPGGERLELVQSAPAAGNEELALEEPAAVAPALESALAGQGRARGLAALSLEVDGFVVTITAPVAEDSLRVLRSRIR